MADQPVQPIVIDASRHEQQHPAPDYAFTQQAQEKMETLMRWQLDIEETMTEVRRKLKGIYWDEEKSGYVQSDKKRRVMNDEGIDAVMDEVEISIANKNTPFGNIDENGARRISKDLHQSISRLLYEKEIEFGLDRSRYSPFCRSISHFTYLLLTRPVGEGERHFLQPILKYIEDARSRKDKDDRTGLKLFGG